MHGLSWRAPAIQVFPTKGGQERRGSDKRRHHDVEAIPSHRDRLQSRADQHCRADGKRGEGAVSNAAASPERALTHTPA